jgi:hypothetical protein
VSVEPVDDHAAPRCQQHVAAARATCIVTHFGLRLAPPAVLRFASSAGCINQPRDAGILIQRTNEWCASAAGHGLSTNRAADMVGSRPRAILLPLPRAATGCNVKPNAKMAATGVAAESLATATQVFSNPLACCFYTTIKGLPLFRPPTEAP